MSVDKKGILSEQVRDVSQDEAFYCEMASILNGLREKTRYSRRETLRPEQQVARL